MSRWPPLDRPLVSVRHLGAVLALPPERLQSLAGKAEDLYDPFMLPQLKNGRWKERPIDNPDEELKAVQKRIKERLLDTLVFPPFMCGGVRKGSTQANARPHVRQPEVVALDIKNFFGHVSNLQVAKVWHEHFNASNEVAWLLTRLTTYRGHLPQGAPTSTALANLVILPVVKGLALLCRVRGVNLTIYVDDITVSGRGARQAIPIVANALSAKGFKLARNKVKIMPANARQEVTGHTVNRKLSNGRELLARARQETLRAIGPEGTERDLQRARGLLAHICGTSASQGAWLKRRIEHAVGPGPRAQATGT